MTGMSAINRHGKAAPANEVLLAFSGYRQGFERAFKPFEVFGMAFSIAPLMPSWVPHLPPQMSQGLNPDNDTEQHQDWSTLPLTTGRARLHFAYIQCLTLRCSKRLPQGVCFHSGTASTRADRQYIALLKSVGILGDGVIVDRFDTCVHISEEA
ncbi:hypothetical protein FRC10_008861 [Ceratobasidium sp. 414]|nr:hypothetical protein FRC10_008861 [Ceratobasidium sp. 414]